MARPDRILAAVALAAGLLPWIPLPLTWDLAPSAMQAGQGRAWLVELPTRPYLYVVDGDTPERPAQSRSSLLEDGVAIGPAHSQHEDIRARGGGAFSHWHASVLFSTSDGSDPSANGRRYALKVAARLSPWPASMVLAVALPLLGWRNRSWLATGAPERIGSLRHIGLATAPVLVVAILTLLAFRWSAGDRVTVRPPSTEYAIVDAQLARISRTPADIAFVGDSSCLFGIDAPELTAALGRKVENFCTLAYVGPLGYAYMLDDLVRGGLAPDATVVVMVHGLQFVREPSWESWPEYVRAHGSPGTPGFVSVSRFATWQALEPLVFSVLPGSWGRYYASESMMKSAVERGELVHPSDRNVYTPSIVPPFIVERRMLEPTEREAPKSLPKAFRYQPDAAFLAAAPKLREAIRRLDRRTLLVVSPIPDSLEDATTRVQRERVRAELAGLFGIAPENVLQTPGALPAELFLSTTHLAPLGREAFSQILVGALRERAVRR